MSKTIMKTSKLQLEFKDLVNKKKILIKSMLRNGQRNILPKNCSLQYSCKLF